MVIEPRTIEIRHRGHAALAKQITVNLARNLGFDHIGVEEIGIVVMELATNLVKYKAKNGRITSCVVDENGQKAIEIVSIDSGPGIENIELTMEDGYSTSGTIGSGLGAVNRLMDEFSISSKTADPSNVLLSDVGTYIECHKWLPEKSASKASHLERMDFSVMVRPMPGEQCSGDGYFIKHYDSVQFIALLDGLGHGEKAHIAMETAIKFIRNNYKKSLEHIFQGVHRVCQNTRGVVMSVCRMDLEKKTFTYAGIGNVSTRVFDSPEPINPVNFSGTLGVMLRKVHVFEYSWKGGIIVMYTDGIKNRWSLDDFPELRHRHPVEITTTLLRHLGRNNDDAAIIVGKLI